MLPCPWLNGKNVVFGHVVEGMDVIKQIETYGSETGVPTRRILVQDCGQVWNQRKSHPYISFQVFFRIAVNLS